MGARLEREPTASSVRGSSREKGNSLPLVPAALFHLNRHHPHPPPPHHHNHNHIISPIINRKGQLAPSLTCSSTLATSATLSQLHQYHQHHHHHHHYHHQYHYEYHHHHHHHPSEKEHQAQLSQVAKLSLSLVGQQRSSFVATHFVHTSTTAAISKY